MTPTERIINNLLPRAEGLLLGTIGGLQEEECNKEGVARTLNEVVGILHKIRSLLEPELSNQGPIKSVNSQQLSDAEYKKLMRCLWPHKSRKFK